MVHSDPLRVDKLGLGLPLGGVRGGRLVSSGLFHTAGALSKRPLHPEIVSIDDAHVGL